MLLPKGKWGWIRASALILILLAVGGYFVGLPALRYVLYDPKEGDIVFQSLPARSDLVRTIEGVSWSPFSHCGVMVKDDGRWFVIEALGHVHKTPLFTWICRGRGSRIAAYRVKPAYRGRIPAFLHALETFMDRPYDYKYRMDDDAIYCSELIWKAWKNATGQEMGTLQRLGDLNWRPWKKQIEEIEEGPPPLDVEIITPRRLSEAPQLERVFDGGF